MDKRRRPIFRGKNPQNQMQLIVSALGCPTDTELDFCTSTSSRDVLRKVCERTKAEGIPPWDFLERFRGADPQALDLLQKMLVFDPKKRITADEALNHPFLAEIHSHWHTLKPPTKFDFSFEKVHHDCSRDRIIPKNHLQNLFLYEVNKYRPVCCRIPTPLHLKKASSSTKSGSRSKRSSEGGAQILKISHTNQTKSNQQLESLDNSVLPLIGVSNVVSGDKEFKVKEEESAKVKEKEVKGKSKKAPFKSKKVVPIKDGKLSQSLKPVSGQKDKMLSRTRRKSASTSALLRKQSSTRGDDVSLIRHARKFF